MLSILSIRRYCTMNSTCGGVSLLYLIGMMRNQIAHSQLPIVSTQYIIQEIMSDSQSEPDGFRSREEDLKRRHQQRALIIQQARFRTEPPLPQNSNSEPYQGLSRTLQPPPKSDSEEDVDMFGDGSVGEKEVAQEETTDESGYYNVVSGRMVAAGRYKLIEKVGKGMFGVVASAEEKGGRVVALKIIRKNEMMMVSGERQYRILSGLKKPEHIVGVLDYFHESGHLFLVMELMGADLRSYVRKNQDKVSLANLRSYAISMFMGLHELRKGRIIHADIKPDNFLLTPKGNTIKLSDFGTAFSVEEHAVEVDYLVARYYRAPEIILGCETPPEQRYGIDTWAVGCSLFELFTGQFLFEGRSNNDMLRLIMQTRGRFSLKMLRKCRHFEKYFDAEYNFIMEYYDPQSKQLAVRVVTPAITPERELLNLLRKNCQFEQDLKVLLNFKDFLESCLALNPKNRLTPESAFLHPFLNHMVKLS